MNPITYRDAKRRYQSPRWRQLRRWVLDRDGHRCRGCGAAGRLECDHIENWRDGGAFWSPQNLQVLCRGCHIQKSAREVRLRGRAWRDRLRTL